MLEAWGKIVKHHPKIKKCSRCIAKKGGVCQRHGAKPTIKTCSHEGCTNQAQNGGACVRHGAEVKICSHEGCSNHARSGGVCTRHGAKRTTKRCRHEGCTNIVVKGGVCVRHGAKRTTKRCGHEGCTNKAFMGGVCVRHGAKRKNAAMKDEQTIPRRGSMQKARGLLLRPDDFTADAPSVTRPKIR